MEKNLMRPDPGDFLAGHQIDNLLYFYGVVRDNEATALEDAVVTAYACLKGGIEKFLESTFTNREGAYYICVPKPDYNGLLGFKVRASKVYILSEGDDSQNNLVEHPHEEETLKQEDALDDETADALTEYTDTDTIQEDGTQEQEDPLEDKTVDALIEHPDIIAIQEDETQKQEVPLEDETVDALIEHLDIVAIQEDKTHEIEYSNIDPVIKKALIDEDANSQEEAESTETLVRIDLNALQEVILPMSQMDSNSIQEVILPAVPTEAATDASTESETSPEVLAESPIEKVSSRQGNLKKDPLPKKNPYDVYRSTYWRWPRR